MSLLPDPNPIVHVAADPVDDPALRDRADALAKALGLAVVHFPAPPGDGLLVVTPQRLELRWPHLPGEEGHHRRSPIAVDLLAVDGDSGPGRSLRQPLAVAVGLARRRRRGGGTPPPYVLDATGGLGEDAWLLAALGCTVEVCERHPVVAALLEDGLARAAQHQPAVAARLCINPTDARQRLAAIRTRGQARPDVLYLDPMFPPRRGTAAERRPLRVLRQLVGADGDADALFAAARAAAAHRVVVKRPRAAPPLGSPPAPPDLTCTGKALRYDVYFSPTDPAGDPAAAP